MDNVLFTYTWEKLSWIYEMESVLTNCFLFVHNRVASGVWPIEAQGWLYDVREFIHNEYDKQDGNSLNRFIKWVNDGDSDRMDFIYKEIMPFAFQTSEVTHPRYLVNVDYMIMGGLVKHKQLEFLACGDHDAMDKVLQAYVNQEDEFPWSVTKLEFFFDTTTPQRTLDMTAAFNKFAGNLLE